MHEHSCFLTLTYDENNLPSCGHLQKEHIQKFLKRLRKKIKIKIKFFLCGEYGDLNLRPHYHAVIFGYNFPDKERFKQTKGHTIYTSEELSELWPYGHSSIGDVTIQSAGYVARYTLKKVDKVIDEQSDKPPEFLLMSRNKGLGYTWYKKYKHEIYPNDYIVINGQKYPVPKYYDSLLKSEDIEAFELVKQKRAERRQPKVYDNIRGKKIIIGRNDTRQNIIKEEILKNKIKSLQRRYDAGET